VVFRIKYRSACLVATHVSPHRRTKASLKSHLDRIELANPARRGSPFWFVLLKDLPFGVIPDDLGVDEAAQIEALRTELSHIRKGGDEAMRCY